MSDEDTMDGSAAPEVAMQHGVLAGEGAGVDAVLFPTRDEYPQLARTLADDGFHMPTDLTAVDYLASPAVGLPDGVESERFEVVVHLRDLFQRRLVRIRVQVPEEDPTLASLYDLFPGTEAMEREVYDMFGITFEGHPDLTRILMPETWEGHPLRKDFEPGRIPVQFKEANS